MTVTTSTAPSASLNISGLTITDFRNYAHADLAPKPGLVILTGENGAGKTNLLEAVSLLAPGRGLRGVAYSDLARQSGPGVWAVSANISGPDGPVKIGTGLTRGGPHSDILPGRAVRIDEQPAASTSALGELVRILWLTPAMDRLFAGPAGDRRRFLDRLVLAIDPHHGPRAGKFEKAMRERNKLLSNHGAEPSWLAGLEQQMAETGVAISAARRDAIGVLSDLILRNAGQQSDFFPAADISLDGQIEKLLEVSSAVEVEDEYRRILRDSRHLDQAAGRTLTGPHRSDVIIRHALKDMPAKLCSTGEQKALLISIILAQSDVVKQMFNGASPLLLLDEVAAHLDEARRSALFHNLREMGIQAWMTGTEPALFDAVASSAQIYDISGGQVIETA